MSNPPSPTTDLAALVRAYRGRLGLSRAELGARWGVADGTIRNIEQGRRAPAEGALVDLLSQVLDTAQP